MYVCVSVCLHGGRLHTSQMYVCHGKTNARVCISGRYTDRQTGRLAGRHRAEQMCGQIDL